MRTEGQRYIVPLDEIPLGWARATIEETISYGGLFIDGDWVESKDQDPCGNVRLIQLADIGDGVYHSRSNRFLTHDKALQLGCTFLQPNDVLIARMPDPLGRACIFSGDTKSSVTVVDVCIVRTGANGLDHKWLVYTINSPAFRTIIASLQSGSTRKRISRGNLANIEFPIPPLPEQHRIVAKIEELFIRLDAGVEALNKIKLQLKRYRQSVLKSAFEGKLTADWREAHKSQLEPASALLERVKEERKRKLGSKYNEPPQLDTSDLGELPEGWVWTTYAQIGQWLGGGTPSKEISSYWDNGTIPWVSPKDIKEIRVSKTEDKITPLALKKSAANLIPQGSLLFVVRSGIIRRTLPIALSMMDIAVNQDLKALLPSIHIYPDYLLFITLAMSGSIRKDCSKGGTTVESIEFPLLKNYFIPLPSVGEQKKLVAEIELHFSVIDAIEKSIEQSLTESNRLHQSILKRAFEGKLVPQDPNDEPVEKLLERIKAAKAKTESKGKTSAKGNLK